MCAAADSVNTTSYKLATLRWFEQLISERIADGIRCEMIADDSVLLVLSGSETFVKVAIRPETYTRLGTSDLPCGWWDYDGNGWGREDGLKLPAPGYSELPSPLISKCNSGFEVHVDLIGIVYWMLNRIEEVGRTDLDQHQRFISTSSHAHQHNYLERPIADEWLHVLEQVIRRTWPSIDIKRHHFSMMVSHDVDVPSCYAFQNSAGKIVRHMGGDLYRRHNPVSAMLGPWIHFRSKNSLHPLDSMNTFSWIMDQSEAHGLTSAFNFICGRTNRRYDADYDIDDPAIRQLLRDISTREHEIGLHPSFETYHDPDALASEAAVLRRVCAEEGINQQSWGGRMHVLRWEQPNTLYGWERAGMSYDNTLSYVDRAGFRCGTCHEYQAFDPVAEKTLNLRIRPLIAMEVTVIADRYMGLGTGTSAFQKFNQLKDACRAVNGNFTLLWHNHQLTTRSERRLYLSIFE